MNNKNDNKGDRMKKLRCISLIFFCFLAKAQSQVQWKFEAIKIGDKQFEVHLTPTVQSPWHIYSQTSPEGGALPTTINFKKNPLVSIEGKTKEVGKVVSKYEEVFDVTVKYFEGKADFVQVVRLKANVKTTLTGTVEYMACNEEQCLPPAEQKFTITLN